MLADPPVERAREQLRRAVAVPAQSAGRGAGWHAVPGVRRQPARRLPARDRAVRSTSQLRDDRSVVDLLTANYTFVNERLARHYGIPNVYGSQFRRVSLDESPRARAARSRQHPDRHLVRQPDVAGPARQVAARERPRHAAAAAAARRARVSGEGRRRIRRDPSASAWNSIGRTRCAPAATRGWIRSASRSRTSTPSANGARRTTKAPPIDASGALPDGTTFEGPAELRAVLLTHREEFVATVAEKLLTYALGRGLELLRPAGGPPDRARRASRRLPLVVARARGRQERSVSDAQRAGSNASQ